MIFRQRAEKTGTGYQTLINETLKVSLLGKAVAVTVEPARLSRDPQIMSGALLFSGTRVPVKAIFDYLQDGQPLAEFLEDFPTVSKEHAVLVLEAAHEQLSACDRNPK